MKMFKLRKKRAMLMLKELKKVFKGEKIRTELNYKTPWQLLVAVILSAQCTDKRVNIVTEKLFKKYKSINDYANASISNFEKDIKSTGFYKNKAKNIINSAKIIINKFNGKVPNKMDDLISLPGVARKTANVVLSNAFGINEGIAVDTHVRRFAIRFDLSDYKDPKRIEKDLMELVQKKDWNIFSNLLIMYGRKICPAKKHDCTKHPLTKIYPKSVNIWPKAK